MRKFFWSLFSSKVHTVTCPTKSTMKKLEQLHIFSKEKLKLLYDPVLNIKFINSQKMKKLMKGLLE